MNNRRHIQQAHERAVVKDFLKWLSAKHGTKYVVIDKPNPPEAVIRSVRRTRWIEVGDVFWTGKYARDVYSYATPGETHRPVGPGPGYLILCMHHPWFDKVTITAMKDHNSKIDKEQFTGYFCDVFISFSSLNEYSPPQRRRGIFR